MKTPSTKTSCVLATALLLTGLPRAHADWKTNHDAIQRVYLKGVPHTDRQGRPMLKYDAARSFLPISIYHAFEGEDSGVKYRLADLKKAGFTCAFAWPGQDPTVLSKSATEAGLQMVYWGPDAKIAKQHVNDPSLFGYFMDDEPIGSVGPGMQARFDKIEQRAKEIRAVDKDHPIFLIDAAWIVPPATTWWVKLNTWGDISSHDNYPINSRNQSLSHAQGIPESVSLAVAINKEAKPFWFVAQNHEYQDPRFQCTFPSAMEQRCMVYTSLIHGATGIVQFVLDSFIARDGRCIGIAPNPQPKYSLGVVATKNQVRQSRDMWEATVDLNAELNELRPALLSPTADIPYEVALDDAWKPVTKDPIRTLLKVNPAGGYTLLLANIDDAPQHVRVRFPDKKDYKLTELFNAPGASGLARQDDSFEFLSAPYDVRVFQIDMK